MGVFIWNVLCMLCYVREFICVLLIFETVLFRTIPSYYSDAFNYTIIIQMDVVAPDIID